MAHDIASVILLLAGFRAGVPIGLVDAALPEAELTDRLSALGQFGVAMVHDNACSDFFQSRINVVVAADKPGRAFDPTPVAPDGDGILRYWQAASFPSLFYVILKRGKRALNRMIARD